MLPLLTAAAVTPAVVVAYHLVAPVAPTVRYRAFWSALAQHRRRLALDVVLSFVCVIHDQPLRSTSTAASIA